MPARMRRIDEGLEVGVGAEMRIDAREVGHPIAVIARAFLPRRALHRLVLEDRRQPDRRRAEPLDIVEPLGQALEVAAVEDSPCASGRSRSPADRRLSPPRSFAGSPFSNRSGSRK